MRFLFRLVTFPFRVFFAALAMSVRTGYRAGRLPTRLAARTVRIPGLRGWVFLLLGLALGLLLAPWPGAELRARLQALLAARAEGEDLAGRVAFELAHAPRTWHLDQPDVSTVGSRVELRGTAVDDDARDELGRVAAAIPGVTGVDNLLVVAAPID
jgi:hypothetical protein